MQVLLSGQPSDLFIEGITSNALSSEIEDRIQTKSFPALRPTPSFPAFRPTPAFLPLRPTPAFPPLRPTHVLHPDRSTFDILPNRPGILPDRINSGFRAYSCADAVAALEEALLAAHVDGGDALNFTVSLGQLLFLQILPDVALSTAVLVTSVPSATPAVTATTSSIPQLATADAATTAAVAAAAVDIDNHVTVSTSTPTSLSESFAATAAVPAAASVGNNSIATAVNIPICSSGIICQADLEAASIQPYFNSFPLAVLKPGLLRSLVDQGYQLTTRRGEDHFNSYTQVNIRAEPEQLSASVLLGAVDYDLPQLPLKDVNAGDVSSTDAQPDMSKPVKIIYVKTER